MTKNQNGGKNGQAEESARGGLANTIYPLGRLMPFHVLTQEGVAYEIDRILTEVIAIQKPHVAETCPLCRDACCSKVQHLFDEKDLILARVLGRPEMTKRRAHRKRGCTFLVADGCGLHPLSRPFMCHRYLCPALEASISTQTPRLFDELMEKLSVLEGLRSRLYECYLSFPHEETQK